MPAAVNALPSECQPLESLAPLAARLAPFPTCEAAERSLLIEGAELDCDGAR